MLYLTPTRTQNKTNAIIATNAVVLTMRKGMDNVTADIVPGSFCPSLWGKSARTHTGIMCSGMDLNTRVWEVQKVERI